MSIWTQVSGLSKYASDALKTAQNNIEKVLDEKDSAENGTESINSDLIKECEVTISEFKRVLEDDEKNISNADSIKCCENCSENVTQFANSVSNLIKSRHENFNSISELISKVLISSRTNKNSTAFNNNSESDQDYQALVTEGKKLSEEIIKKNEHIKGLRESLKKSKAQIEDDEAIMNKLKDYVTELEGNIELFEMNKNEQSNIIRDLQSRLDLIESGSVEKSEPYQKILKSLEDLKRENQVLNDNVDQVKLKDDEITSLTDKLQSSLNLNEILQSRVFDLERKLEEAEKENERVSTYFKDIIKKHEETKEELTKSLQNTNLPLVNEVNSLRKRLEAERKSSQAKIKSLYIDLEIKSSEIKNKDEIIEELNKKLNEGPNSREELNARNEEIASLKLELESNLKRFHKSLDEKKLVEVEMKEEEERLNRRIEEITKENGRLLQSQKELLLQMETSKDKEEKLNQLLNEKEHEQTKKACNLLTESSEEVSTAEKIISSTSFGYMENIKQSLNLSELDNKKLRNEVNRLKFENEELVREVNSVERKMQGQLDELNSRYETLLELHGEKIEELSQIQVEFDEVKETFKRQINDIMK